MFGPDYARRLRRRRGRMGDTWYLDEVFVTIQGQQQYLWRAVDEDGDVIDILVQSRRNRRAAKRFFLKLLKRQGCEPRRLITDKLRSYSAAHRIVMPSVVTILGSTKTAERRSRINRRASASGRCAGSNRPLICNGSHRCTASSRICSGSAVTCSGQLTTVS